MARHGRRHFLKVSAALAALGALTGCGSLSVPWQKPPKIPRIGFLAVGSREGRAFLIEAFRRGLDEQGYEEGRNILIEYRFSEDRDDRLPELAAELVDLPVDLILASGSPASVAAASATGTIPIVMGGMALDPVGSGLIKSLARPGRNITGMSMMTAPLGGKRLELLKEIIPGLELVAVLNNPTNPAYRPVLAELHRAAPMLSLGLLMLEVQAPADLEPAFADAARQGAGALIVPADPLTTNRQPMMADLALKHPLPAVMEYKEYVQAGGLLSLGVDLADLYRRSAKHVDKILKGADPAELPMEQPTQLDVGVNLPTARALGLEIPGSVLMQATLVIP
jgi:putative tryptophan/tyrosine transport system substrate-binding protein